MKIELLPEKTNEKDVQFSNPLVFHLKTNSEKIEIEYEVTDIINGNFPHVSLNSREGIHLLYKKDGWKNFDIDYKNSKFSLDLTDKLNEENTCEILIYGPILSNLGKLSLRINDNCYLEQIKNKDNILIAGGIHSLGIGCNAVSTMFSTIVSRKMNLEPHYLVYYNRNFLEQLYKYFKDLSEFPKYKYGILELDYVFQDNVFVDRHLKQVINFMMKSCENLICWYTLPPNQKNKKNKIFNILEPILNGENIILEDSSFIYEPKYADMCTYSNNFINDTGNIMIYKRIVKNLEVL
ncbi:MAG: hypothetical protein E7Z85_02655 [Methanosphaera stadtmanae]|nr:hypothetical protein [Methanosphaera stadtmanae]